MKKSLIFKFLFLLVIFVLSALAVWPKGPNLDLRKIGIPIYKEMKLNKGLDLQGGIELTYELDTKDVSRQEAQDKAITVIRNRIDAFGVAEPNIYPESFGNSSRIIVQLPGMSNMDEAMGLIGKTAQLQFKEEDSQGLTEESIMMGGSWKSEPALSGSDLKRSDVGRDETGNIIVNLTFSGEGATKFQEATRRSIGKRIGIFLDDNLISSPMVSEEISGGKAKITADFDLKEAKNLSIQLNAGALPVPMKLVQQKTVGATLGEESIHRSVVAALVGFLAIIIFLIAYYHFLGLLNVFSLVTYTLITLSLFKLFSITLTLAGIAGFILSAGAAAEASVLILERIREEIRKGSPVELAIEAGYKGAWSSIWDSNIVSFLLAIIIFYLGTGLVRGFGLTLALGVVISILIVKIVDLPMLKFLASRKFIRNKKLIPLLFGVRIPKDTKEKK
ncbi:protein translocase subunit SecD [bacterium]|nr:protein translocase subunit SecD [bacterium]